MSEQEKDNTSEWIQWFCSLKGNEFFCEVDKAWIDDAFNLIGLAASMTNYSDVLKIILDRFPTEQLDSRARQIYFECASQLYGYIHARYILSPEGMKKMAYKFEHYVFGYCPRHGCDRAPVLPIGVTDIPGRSSVKLYCPICEECYEPRQSRYTKLDGCFFTTTFAPYFMLVFQKRYRKMLKVPKSYTPKVYGFKIHYDEEGNMFQPLKKNAKKNNAALKDILGELNSE
ncbi:hypothetical protein PCE1_002753 [Barthelona sp. PCE]